MHSVQLYIHTNFCTYVKDIQGMPISGNFMISFDVESLFINILLDECIDLAVRVTHFYFTLALLRFGGVFLTTYNY